MDQSLHKIKFHLLTFYTQISTRKQRKSNVCELKWMVARFTNSWERKTQIYFIYFSWAYNINNIKSISENCALIYNLTHTKIKIIISSTCIRWRPHFNLISHSRKWKSILICPKTRINFASHSCGKFWMLLKMFLKPFPTRFIF